MRELLKELIPIVVEEVFSSLSFWIGWPLVCVFFGFVFGCWGVFRGGLFLWAFWGYCRMREALD